MQTETMGRDRLFNVRLNDEEWNRIERLCGFYGVNAATLVRLLLKKEERERDQADPGWEVTDKGRMQAYKAAPKKRARKS